MDFIQKVVCSKVAYYDKINGILDSKESMILYSLSNNIATTIHSDLLKKKLHDLNYKSISKTFRQKNHFKSSYTH